MKAYRGDMPIAEWLYLRELEFQKDFTMPSVWKRAEIAALCGYCPHRSIKIGEPMLVITIGGNKKEHRRCQDCAGQAPPDLPQNPERGPRERDPIAFQLAKDAAPKFNTRGDVKRFAERWSPHNS